MPISLRRRLVRLLVLVLVLAGSVGASSPLLAQTSLADQPVFTAISIPGNLALTLSVEYPTAVSNAHTTDYAATSEFLGYFDPNKCYTYMYNSTTPLNTYFQPSGAAVGHTCSGKWSGNFLNWATMQTVDAFRWALTGGLRSTDTSTMTVLERAYASGQGGTWNFADRYISGSALISGATPMAWNYLNIRNWGMGAQFRINSYYSGSDTYWGPATDLTTNAASAAQTNFDIYVHVKVCDSSAAAGGLELNCKQYGTSYKPEGLIQQYSDRVRFSAFSYLLDSTIYRDGGVLRARQKFVGPTQPVPGSTAITNPLSEWSTVDGTMIVNPDSADASKTSSEYGTPITNSGVMNYLNKFGSISRNANSYKAYDPVSELYYAALRYYRNLGNVPEWSNARQTNPNATTADVAVLLDSFPVITTWDDPIQYSCQKNFILGIGDLNTSADRNLPGSTGPSEPPKPAAVAADTSVNAMTATDAVGAMAGIPGLSTNLSYPICCANNGALMAGLAYDANTGDIRPDDPNDPKTIGRQSVQTYWLDVVEWGYQPNGQFYLAAKYGGFTVPPGFKPYSQGATDIPLALWHTGPLSDTVGGQLRPDNYYTADRPDLMVNGLTSAFSSIASKLKAYTTSFSTSLSQVASSSLGTYATQYDARNWTGELIASFTTLATPGTAPTQVQAWQFSSVLAKQASGTGWDNGRTIVTFNTTSKVGVPFRTSSLAGAQLTALDTSYRSGNDSTDYLNYLRGDRSQEQGSIVSGSSKAYRARTGLLGDIVNSKALPVAPPAAPYSEDANPGYTAFKTDALISKRKAMVYVGANDGMLHAVDGSLSGATAGQEVFAYVPGALYSGPSGTPNTDGLAALGNPNFVHHYYVDSTPVAVDVDFQKTVGGGGAPDWHTMLVGGMGKGGKAVYALDITNPGTITSEATAATKVLWEFTDADLGFTYSAPAIAKTKKYGWVVMFSSGYNNTSGIGYLFIVNPRTGALLEKISTGAGGTSASAGMAAVQTFLLDIADGTADAVYAGDLLGNLWRFDLIATSGSYPAPVKIAVLKDAMGNALAVTSRPLVMVQPSTNKRFVTVGTGRLLATGDFALTQIQTFFAIIDGVAARPGKASDLPPSVSYPITRSNLHQLTDLTQPVKIDLSREVGWYVDLGSLGAGSGWRVVADPTGYFSSVIFTATLPSTADACNPSGQSRVYVIDLGTGVGTVTQYSALVTDITVITSKDPSGQPVTGIYQGKNDGTVSSVPVPTVPPLGYRRLNWREIPIKN